jgi:competence protein ComEA
MNEDSARQFIATLRHWVAFIGVRRIIAMCGGLVVAVGVGWFVFKPSPEPVEFVLPSVSSSQSTVIAGQVQVHVVGAVKKPGVYLLPGRSRVVDAVNAAGGSLPSADLEGINLAQTLMDAEQVFIPQRRVSRPRITVAPRLQPRPHSSSTTVAPGSPVARVVNINTATATELDSLTGVGPATARAIIAYRSSKGSFAKVEDLLNVPGIGPSKLAAMRDEISLS